MKLTIDFNEKLGAIKPLHGVCNSPVSHGEAIPTFKDAGIPYVRLHDTGGAYGGHNFVDIPNVFRNFSADPDDPASYDFAFTDALLNGLAKSGCQIFYRLGVTIENYWKIKAYRIAPPADFSKWAKICAGVVRHYNEGWANGLHLGIKYWEIWNEPENPPMWTGTREQFYELYRVTANYLKSQFPQLKVGGYAGCGFYAITRDHQNDFYKSFVSYYTDFLKYITAPATKAPLDFFSWHLYNTDPKETLVHATYVTEQLRAHGLDKTENIFNEWNYIDGTPQQFDQMKEMPGACFVGETFCRLQHSPVDIACLYDALPSRRYCGLYYFPSMKPSRTYYAFKAYNELYKLGTEVRLSSDNDKIQALAAVGEDGNRAVLIVNRNPSMAEIKVECDTYFKHLLLLDSTHQLSDIPTLILGQTITLPANSLCVLA